MNDEFEILISQSLDGLLSPEDQAKLDVELARNPEARRLLEEYRSLDEVVKTTPLPRFNEDYLHRQISRAVAAQKNQPTVYAFPIWARWTVGVAAAACIAVLLGIHMQPAPRKPLAVGTAAHPVRVAVMNLGEAVNSQPIAGVSIGPQPGMDRSDLAAREALTQVRSTVAIDSAAAPVQDDDRTLY